MSRIQNAQSHITSVILLCLLKTQNINKLTQIVDIFCKIVEKLKTSRSSAFASDLNLLSYDINECCASATDPGVSRKIRSDLRQTASVKMASIKTESHGKDYDWQWLQDEDGCKSRLNVGG